MSTLQLQRQAVSHKAILDFTVQRSPEFPVSVTKRFPELQGMAESIEKQRINLQLQLREQFVAIREMLDKVASLQNVEALRQTINNDIHKLEQKITVINQITNQLPGNATDSIFGLVTTDKTVANPNVYLKETVDELLAALTDEFGSSISTINQAINVITAGINAQAIPLIILENSGENPNNPLIQGVAGIFGNQRAINIADGGNLWTWAGDPWNWVPG